MRLLVFVLLAVVPLSGCLGGQAPVASIFGAWQLPSGDPTPVALPDCDTLLETLNERAFAEADASLQQSLVGGGWHHGGAVMEVAAADGARSVEADMAYSARGAEVTGTNNQEADADEGDILKTDGEWTYVLRGDLLHVLHSESVGDVASHATVQLDGPGVALLLAKGDPDDPLDDRLVVTVSQWNAPVGDSASDSARGDQRMMIGRAHDPWTQVQVLGLADRAAPAKLHESYLEGHATGSRFIDGYAYVVVQRHGDELGLQTWVHPDEEDLSRRGMTWEEYWRAAEPLRRSIHAELVAEARAENRQKVAEATIEDHLPRRLEARGGTLAEDVVDDADCRRFLVVEDATGRATTTVLALQVDGAPEVSTTSLVGSSPIVYGTSGSLVLASAARDPWWFIDAPRMDEATDLHWLRLDGLDVTIEGSGRIPGTVLDSFAIDVEGRQLRVATTTGQWNRGWVEDPEPMLNHIVVLEALQGALVPTGIVGGIAPGERIWSARFTEDRAYIITFEQIDPLWIVDLSDPTLPRILGELEIPGVSTYIHPLSDDLLLTIGYGAAAGGRGLDWSRVELSLFDISDPSDPRRAALLDISPPGGGWSHATQEHKAFTYWDALGLLAVPVDGYQRWQADGRIQDRPMHVLRLIDVDTEARTLTIRGDLDQGQLAAGDAYGGSIERSYFLGYPGTPILSVYALSHLGMTAHDLRTLSDQGSAAFEQHENGYWYGRLG